MGTEKREVSQMEQGQPALWAKGEAGMIAQSHHSSHGAFMAVLWSAEREQVGKAVQKPHCGNLFAFQRKAKEAFPTICCSIV